MLAAERRRPAHRRPRSPGGVAGRKWVDRRRREFVVVRYLTCPLNRGRSLRRIWKVDSALRRLQSAPPGLRGIEAQDAHHCSSQTSLGCVGLRRTPLPTSADVDDLNGELVGPRLPSPVSRVGYAAGAASKSQADAIGETEPRSVPVERPGQAGVQAVNGLTVMPSASICWSTSSLPIPARAAFCRTSPPPAPVVLPSLHHVGRSHPRLPLDYRRLGSSLFLKAEAGSGSRGADPRTRGNNRVPTATPAARPRHLPRHVDLGAK